MVFLGLVPGKRSAGDPVRRASLTLAGNRRARRALLEAAWTYPYPARISHTLRIRLEGDPWASYAVAAHGAARVETCKAAAVLQRSIPSTAMGTLVMSSLLLSTAEYRRDVRREPSKAPPATRLTRASPSESGNSAMFTSRMIGLLTALAFVSHCGLMRRGADHR